MTTKQDNIFTQSNYHIRCEWGLRGVETLASCCDAIIIVDVLSFSTAVSIAVANGGMVYPYPWRDDGRQAFAKEKNAILAAPRGKGTYTLSPSTLTAIKTGQRLVLPSPNGSTLSLAGGDTPTYIGCLRNAKSIANAALRHGNNIGVIPCGERWHDSEHSLRPALEDWLGAGAIINSLRGELTRSPEAHAAAQAYRHTTNLLQTLKHCSSGQELIQRSYETDIHLAAEINHDTTTPMLIDGAFQAS